MSELLLQKREQIDNLRSRLADCLAVTKFGPDEAGTLVHAFSDLEESFRRFLDEQLPKLADPAVKGEELEDLLLDIREDFRHILYHIHDPKFFRLVEPTHEWLAVVETAKK
jgi:hypothetical protein